jgi:hypothetical protein
MSRVTKGLVIGAANIFGIAMMATSFAEGSHRHDGPSLFVSIILFGIVPALMHGALLGWLTGRLAAYRRIVLPALALVPAVVVSVFADPLYAPFVALPAIASGFALEEWTRPDRDLCAMPAFLKGATLGVANVAAIAVLAGIAISATPMHGAPALLASEFRHASRIEAIVGIAVTIGLLGLVPGILAGTIIGWLAGQTARWQRHGWRFVVFVVPAVVVTAVLGVAFDATALILPACIPTAVAAALLARHTQATTATLPIAIRR